MRRGYRWEVIGIGVAVTLTFLIAPMVPAPAADAQTTYGGRALCLQVAPPLLPPTIVGDTGNLPSTGGSLSDAVDNPSISVAGQVVAATRVNCLTAGADVSANSTAEIEGLECTLNQLLLTVSVVASLVRAESFATCGGLGGNTTISDLTVAGVAVTVTGEANQMVDIPGIATLVINEQVIAEGKATVNALHLTLLDGTECIIGSVVSEILDCPPLPVETSTWGKVKALYR